jgi:hypothetical protein
VSTVAAALLLPAACDRDQRVPSGNASAASAVGDTTTPAVITADTILPGFFAVQPLADLNALENDRIARARGDDIGVVYAPGTAWRVSGPAELIIRSDSNERATIVSYVNFVNMPDGGWRTVHAGRDSAVFGDLERAGHEDYGLPGQQINERWARVVYGYNRAGEERSGWIRLHTDTVKYTAYDAQLFEFDTRFTNPDSVEFFDAPNGNPVPFPLTRRDATGESADDYTVRVLRVQDGWYHVRVAVPDTAPCTGDEQAKVTRRADLWVTRTNRSGRRQMWAAVAGC